ncbi:MAG TPA: T9SS type A sorting domain-containing protein [Bacteroidia bacterium]|jgi:hypothetical protein|nr:T9SS type A sorting domain-containing protein [Bacteroidia bacterium]
MKKFIPSIALISLSLFTIEAIAQTPANYIPTQIPAKPRVVVKTVQNLHHATKHKISSGSSNGFLDYVDGDANNRGYTFWNSVSGNYVNWSPPLYLNSKFTAKDTVYSPMTSANANTYTVNSVTVVYDTLWDNYAFINTANGFVQPIPGSVAIDTIWTILGYHNTSHKNDTLIFTFCGVTAAGFPSNTPVYAADTEIIAPHSASLPGTSLDSVFVVGFIPLTPISIPSSAVGGWHFCVTTTVNGSKLDTLGPAYYSAFTICGASAYSDSVTSIGPVDGAIPHANSFITGLYWFNSSDFGGNGTQETFPLVNGIHAGLWYNTGGLQFFNYTPCNKNPPFIWYPYMQNIAILLSLTYTNDLTTGINNIASSGLSVEQNYPNPFNKTTQIVYNLTRSSDVTFSVYDMTGRVLVNNTISNSGAGQHTINLNANSFSPGIYFYTFNVNGSNLTRKMVITE